MVPLALVAVWLIAAPDAGAPAAPPPPDTACLEGLSAHKIDFAPGPATRGLRTPIRLTGPVGGVRLVHRGAAQAPLMDCELARALDEARRIFEPLGVAELVYSGAYDYRNRRGSPKLSEHAHGFAVDVHAIRVIDGGALREIVVDGVYEKGAGSWPASSLSLVEEPDCVGKPSTADARLLRTLACRLRGSGVFRVVMTPDDDADHRDHFHIEAFPDALSRATNLLGRKPLVEPAPLRPAPPPDRSGKSPKR